MARQADYAVIRVEIKPDGLVSRLWLSDQPSLSEARAEAKRFVEEEDPEAVLKIVPAYKWHHGES